MAWLKKKKKEEKEGNYKTGEEKERIEKKKDTKSKTNAKAMKMMDEGPPRIWKS